MKRTRKVQKLSLLRESQFCKENYSEKRPFLQEYTLSFARKITCERVNFCSEKPNP